jgi:hypothetical protein
VPDPHMGEERCARFTRMADVHHAVIAERHGFDPFYGRRLAGDVAGAGLTEPGCRGRASMWRGGEAGGAIWRMSIEQLGDAIIASGRMDAAELQASLALCDDPGFSSLAPVLMTAWGRRPF